MNYRKMSKASAKDWVAEIDELPEGAFDNLVAQWKMRKIDAQLNNDYLEIRGKVLQAYQEGAKSGNYAADVETGLCLYQFLSEENGFTNVIANDDDVWRYSSCVVFPDIPYERYPTPATGDKRLASKRFYSHTRRIWVKTLWWYIHLSWQGSADATRGVLSGLGSDTISDFIERTGKGYRLPLYRELMRKYSECPNKKSGSFNKLCIQNLVNCRSIEPALTERGEAGYVEYLFMQLDL